MIPAIWHEWALLELEPCPEGAVVQDWYGERRPALYDGYDYALMTRFCPYNPKKREFNPIGIWPKKQWFDTYPNQHRTIGDVLYRNSGVFVITSVLEIILAAGLRRSFGMNR